MTRLAFLAFALLVFEIALSRVFAYALSYHFSPVAMSLALLGVGLGAFLRARFFQDWLPQRTHALGLAALSLAFGAAELSLHGASRPWVPVLAAALPCLLLGGLLAHCYVAAGPGGSHRAYFFDLAGAAAGSLAAIPLLDRLGASGIVLLLLFLSGGAALASAARLPDAAGRRSAVLLAGAGLAVGLLRAAGVLPDPWLGALAAGGKPLHRSVREEGGRILDHAWGVSGRADLYARPDMPHVRWIYNDALNSSLLVQEPKTAAQEDFLRRLLLYLPFEARAPEEALLIGPGGGLETHLARLAGVRRVLAAELNGAVIRLVRRWSSFAGDVYGRPEVELSVAEGRRFLIDRPGPYGLIQLSLVLTASPEFGTYALAEGYLYTQEAYRLYLERLRPDGLLSMADDSPERSLRQLLGLLAVLEERGVPAERAMRHAAVVGNRGADGTGYGRLLLVSPSPLSEVLKDRLFAGARRGGFEPLWIPGRAEAEPYGRLAREGRAALLAAHPLDLGPTRDDRPYFFFMGRGLGPRARLLGPFAAVGLAALFLAGALGWRVRRLLGGAPARPLSLALLLGAGYMLVEVGLQEKLTLAVGGPTRTLSVVLFALLLWSGLGGRLSSRVLPRLGWGLRGACLAAAAATAAAALWLQGRYLFAGEPSALLRSAGVVLLLAPVGACLGLPFPRLLASCRGRPPAAVAALWGVNGLASVGGAMAALLLSFAAGHVAALAAGALLYAGAAWAAGPRS